MKHYAKSEQRQVVAQRHRVPIQLEAVYTLAVRSRHTEVCHVVMVITDLYERRGRQAHAAQV
ncbi:MAG: hypothetical protein ACYDBB_02790 [Armatimonadota bacterium]